MSSLPWCITRLVVFLTSSVAIVVLNLIAIIVFIKNRHLRKRSTYLLINLAVADMLVGGFSELNDFIISGVNCNFWEDIVLENWLIYLVRTSLQIFFTVCSLVNITVISAERLHATFWPFRHRVVKTRVYGLLIAGTWVTSLLLSTGLAVINQRKPSRQNYFYLLSSFNSTCLLVICISYSSIVIKVRCGAQPEHHGAASRERKLTTTLFIVTVVSLLLCLPLLVISFLYFSTDIFSSLSNSANAKLNFALIVLYFANSFVNPIVYACRIPEFRRALVALFRKRPQQLNRAADFPLREM